MNERNRLSILIIDDEPGLRQGLKKVLKVNNYIAFEASNSKEAKNIINKNSVDLVLLDMKLGNESGLPLLDEIKRNEPLLQVVIITGFGTINNAVVCLKAGAIERKLGRFELVGNGTIFLDEIGDMSLRMQSKLLRVLQEKTFERVGGVKSINTNCRVIAATNKDITLQIKQGKFREDLYYRLSLIIIKLPSLKERKKDIKSLIEQFINDANNEYGRNVSKVDPELFKKLENYDWPGNIRQLKNIITNGVILSENNMIKNIEVFNNQNIINEDKILYKSEEGLKTASSRLIEQIEKKIISEVLAANSYNFAKASRELKITRKTLYEKVKKYSISEKVVI